MDCGKSAVYSSPEFTRCDFDQTFLCLGFPALGNMTMVIHLTKLASALPIDDSYELCTESYVKQITFQVVDYRNILFVCTCTYVLMYM